MRQYLSQLSAVFALCALAACSGSGSPTMPATTGLSTPSGFTITRQQVFLTHNQVDVAWSGSASTYRLTAGSTTGASDLLSVDVTGTTYSWMAPRGEAVYFIRVAAVDGTQVSNTTGEFPVYTVDLRNVIDALFFRSGPMADVPANALTNPPAGVWASGTALRILVSSEAGESARAGSQQFADEYATLSGGSITATTELTSDDFRTATRLTVPPFQIFVRVLTNFCGPNVIACAYYGPAPIGLNSSLVTQGGTGGSVASAHELGHAYGMGHVSVNAATRQDLNFMMNPTLISNQMTEPEKNAIRAGLDGGIRGGTTRTEALAAGLVLPFSPVASLSMDSVSNGDRGRARCIIR